MTKITKTDDTKYYKDTESMGLPIWWLGGHNRTTTFTRRLMASAKVDHYLHSL